MGSREIELIWDDPALLGLIPGRGSPCLLHRGPGSKARRQEHRTRAPQPMDQERCGWTQSRSRHRGSMKTTSVSGSGYCFWNWSLAPLERQDDRVMLVHGTFTAAKSSMETIARNMKHPLIVSLFRNALRRRMHGHDLQPGKQRSSTSSRGPAPGRQHHRLGHPAGLHRLPL